MYIHKSLRIVSLLAAGSVSAHAVSLDFSNISNTATNQWTLSNVTSGVDMLLNLENTNVDSGLTVTWGDANNPGVDPWLVVEMNNSNPDIERFADFSASFVDAGTTNATSIGDFDITFGDLEYYLKDFRDENGVGSVDHFQEGVRDISDAYCSVGGGNIVDLTNSTALHQISNEVIRPNEFGNLSGFDDPDNQASFAFNGADGFEFTVFADNPDPINFSGINLGNPDNSGQNNKFGIRGDLTFDHSGCIPEPSSALLFGIGASLMSFRRRR